MTIIHFPATPQLTANERERQLHLWGEQNHPDGTTAENLSIAEAAKESCEAAFRDGKGTWFDILLEEVMEASAEADEDALFVELIQIAAVAESWADAIRRRQQARSPERSDTTYKCRGITHAGTCPAVDARPCNCGAAA